MEDRFDLQWRLDKSYIDWTLVAHVINKTIYKIPSPFCFLVISEFSIWADPALQYIDNLCRHEIRKKNITNFEFKTHDP
jgi:hypothetical protein